MDLNKLIPGFKKKYKELRGVVSILINVIQINLSSNGFSRLKLLLFEEGNWGKFLVV